MRRQMVILKTIEIEIEIGADDYGNTQVLLACADDQRPGAIDITDAFSRWELLIFGDLLAQAEGDYEGSDEC